MMSGVADEVDCWALMSLVRYDADLDPVFGPS